MKKGFTLVELLVVVAILGVLAAVGIVSYSGFLGNAKENATKSNFNSIMKYIETELYKGEIIGRENSTHQVWISKNNYRVPVKLTIPTDLGFVVNQELISTNLPI